jgi:hypothetical protein
MGTEFSGTESDRRILHSDRGRTRIFTWTTDVSFREKNRWIPLINKSRYAITCGQNPIEPSPVGDHLLKNVI